MNEKLKPEFSRKTKDNILSILKTKENANQFTDFVKYLSGKTFSTEGFDIDKVVAKKYGGNIPFWLGGIKKDLVGNNDLECIRNFLLDIENIVDGSPLVRVEISFSPSEDFINSLYEVIGTLEVSGIDKNRFLIEFEINTNLGGGAKIHVGGKYIDVSLKKILVSYLETNNVIKRYL